MIERAPQEGTPVESHESFVLPPLLLEEQPEEYVVRCTRVLSDTPGVIKLEKGLNAQARYQDEIVSALEYAESQKVGVKFSEEKNTEVLKEVQSGITFALNEARPDSTGDLGYEHTNRERWFFGTARKTDNTPYSQLLFGVHCDTDFGESKTLPYFKHILDNKDILLLGGGGSASDLVVGVYGDPEIDPLPHKIINTDVSFAGLKDEPLVQEKIDAGTYVKKIAHAENPEEIKAVLTESELDGVDEIWASYSVPYYLKTPEEIKGLFETIQQSLRVGGTARISPVAFQVPNDMLMNHPEQVDILKVSVVDSVKKLQENPEFNLYTFTPTPGALTLVIKRLKSTE